MDGWDALEGMNEGGMNVERAKGLASRQLWGRQEKEGGGAELAPLSQPQTSFFSFHVDSTETN